MRSAAYSASTSRDGTNVAASAYFALYALQHRGQESCGIAVNDRRRDHAATRTSAWCREVFTHDALETLGTGHHGHGPCAATAPPARHPRINAQPLVVRHVKGHMALAHNGNADQRPGAARGAGAEAAPSSTCTNDSEVICLHDYPGAAHSCRPSRRRSSRAMDSLKGAYSLVIMSPRKADRRARPPGLPAAVHRQARTRQHRVRLGILRAGQPSARSFVRDVEPGEIVVVRRKRPAHHPHPLRRAEAEPLRL